MIEVKGLSKYYSSRKAVENVSFKIEKGEVVGLLGLNGAGKSTILKILGCFLMPTSGFASVGGYSVTSDPDQVRKIIGFLSDSPPLYNEMTVEKYLRFVAALKNVPRSKISDNVDRVVRRTNISDVTSVMLGALSHGYRQRVGIAQSLVHNPDVLILDEPIIGLDPVQIIEMRDLVLSLRGDHTVILSSHILSEITRTCDRILVVDQGALVAEGKEKELSQKFVNNMIIKVHFRKNEERIIDEIKKCDGFISIDEKNVLDGGLELKIVAGRDMRPELANIIVASKGDLLGMQKTDVELENLFLKLVQKN
ncbi:MAG: ATP-binding cassette domain-containing protein [Oligoflexales bacterium]|nr:ATP-binding cassette domain-containing protein [Oligoflexales bacterium]